MVKPPERKYKITIKLEADTKEDAKALLRHFIDTSLDMIDQHDTPAFNGLSVGWSSSYTYHVRINEDMDGDKYRALLEKYMQQMENNAERIEGSSDEQHG